MKISNILFSLIILLFGISTISCNKNKESSRTENTRIINSSENPRASNNNQNTSNKNDSKMSYATIFTGDLQNNNVSSEWLSDATLKNNILTGEGSFRNFQTGGTETSGTKLTINVTLGTNNILKNTKGGSDGIWAYINSNGKKIGIIFAYYTGNGDEIRTEIAMGQKSVSYSVEAIQKYDYDWGPINFSDIDNSYEGHLSNDFWNASAARERSGK